MKILLLADMHWGAIEPQRFKEELDKCLFNKLESLEEDELPDLVIIAGDLFDTKEYFSSPVVDYVYEFITRLSTSLIKTDECLESSEIVLLQGTRSHDNSQLNTLVNTINKWVGWMRGAYICKFPWVSVINECIGEDYNWFDKNDHTFLYIPEEYVSDDSYYDRFFKDGKHYDLIIGHGMIDKIYYAKDSKDNINDLNHNLSAPVFELDKLLEHCNKCYFGHVHNHKIYKERFAYVGPTTKWEFGKDNEIPGYYIITIDEDKNITDEFIPNTLAVKLPTITKIIKSNKSPAEIVNEITDELLDKFKSDDLIERIRFIAIMSKKELKNDYQLIHDMIIESIGKINNVKLIIKELDEEVTDEEISKISEEEFEKVSYVTDKNLDIATKINHFIREKTGKDISIDRINSYLEIPSEENGD